MRALAATALLALAMPAFADCALDYRVMVRWDTQPRRFDVTLTLPARGGTHTLLHVSPEWGGVTDFHRAIREVRTDAGAIEQPAPGTWKVSHPGRARLTVRYSAVNDVADLESPLHHRDFYRTLIGASFFHVFGHSLFLLPEEAADGEPVVTCIRFDGLPRGARFASSFDGAVRAGRASIAARIASTQLAQSIFVGGDFRVLRRQIAGHPLVVALRGGWRFTDERFMAATAAVVKAQREFWGDYDFPHFLVTLLPNGLARGSAGGTAVTGAFAMHASNDFTVPGPRFEHLLAHEHMHTWVPRRIGAMPEDESIDYWFSEGFTNYVSHRLLVRAGFWDLRDYARAMNETIAAYGSSPWARTPNREAAALFWKDAKAHDLPYLRGELMAIAWARRLERSGTTLEATLRALRLPHGAGNGPLATDRLRAAVERVAGSAAIAELAAHVDRAEPFAMDGGFLGPCFERVMAPESAPGAAPAYRERSAAGADPRCRKWMEE